MGRTHNAALTEQVGRLTVERDDALARLKESEEFHAGAPSLTEYLHLCDGIQLHRADRAFSADDKTAANLHRWEREHGQRLVPSES